MCLLRVGRGLGHRAGVSVFVFVLLCVVCLCVCVWLYTARAYGGGVLSLFVLFLSCCLGLPGAGAGQIGARLNP